ncbi:Asp-tRNA(Asn)/Glu-tRNA(Gln) amidotransferase subunit GatB, partial [bacterium]|nr:Asp-tRNA(Asn)/Glu-tRNA(Gln) amidotransferase subunit GatB [bacterium]
MKEKFETVIGLEIHIELKTKTKMFCRCPNEEEAEPNENVCPICLGYPGVLPVPNKKAILYTLKLGLALNCRIREEAKFDRKHYFYPDLPKNYQISQYDMPFAESGFLEVDGRKIGIRRVHLEEDAGKLIHPEGVNYSLVDFNRAGIPLIEVVTEPDIRSPKEARRFLQDLQLVVRYLGISNADMEKGQLRCDANISVRKGKLSTPIFEIKNMNSFRAIERALTYEEERLRENFEVLSEQKQKRTLAWDEASGRTIPMREKEEAEDYRYFPEPDIPLLKPRELFDLKKLKASLPPLPNERRETLRQLKVPEKEIEVLVQKQDWYAYFLKLARKVDPKLLADWMVNENLG